VTKSTPDAAGLDVPRDSAAPGIDAAAATTAGAVVRGGLWGTAGGMIPQVYTLVVSVTAARILGPEEFGRQSFIAFAELSVVMLFTGGLPLALMRSFGERIGAGNPVAVRSLLVWAWAIEAGSALLGGGLLFAAGLAGAEPEGAWLLAGVAATMGVLHTVPSALLLGAQRWRAAIVAGLTTGALGTAATIAVLAAGWGITGMFAVDAAASVVNLIWTSWLARRTLAEVAPPSPVRERVSNRDVWIYAAVSTLGVVLTFIVWRRSELLLLEHFSSETQIGLFSIAFAASATLMKLPDAIANVGIAATATLYGAGAEERIRAGYSRAFRLVLLLTFPLAAAALVLGPEALRVAYGDEYEDTGVLFVVLVAAFPVIPLMTLATSVLIGLGRLRAPLVTTAVAALVNVVLAFALIPRYDALGAAFASSGAQAVGAALAFLYAARAVGGVDWDVGSAVRVGLTAGGVALVAAAGLVVLDGWAGVLVGLVAGAVAFLALARLLRIVSAQDASWLDAAAGHRLRGRVGHWIRGSAGPARKVEG
jgi:O-antigen/teichoic acid export membrane protein